MKKKTALILYILLTVIFAAVIFRMGEWLELAVAVTWFLSPLLGIAAFCVIAGVLIFAAMWLSSIGFTEAGKSVKERLLNKANLIRTGIMSAAAGALLVYPIMQGTVLHKMDEKTAKRALKTADEIVCYDGSDKNISSLEDIKTHSCVMIDHDKKQVTIADSWDGSASFDVIQVKLKKIDPADIKGNVMYQHTLEKNGGIMLRIYGGGNITIGDRELTGRSNGISVEMADGEVWYGSLMKKAKGETYGTLLELKNNGYQMLSDMIGDSDEIKEYGSDAPFACYGLEISSNCVGIDYDTMTVRFITSSQYGMEQDSIEMNKCDKSKLQLDKYGEVFAEIPFSKGTLYAIGKKESWQGDRCNRLIFSAEDGSCYCTPDEWWNLLDLYNSRYGV